MEYSNASISITSNYNRRVIVRALRAASFYSHLSTEERITEHSSPSSAAAAITTVTSLNIGLTVQHQSQSQSQSQRALSTDFELLPSDDDEEVEERASIPIEVIEGLLNKVEIIDDGDICAICMDELKVKDEARAIGHCSHTFHLDCVVEWVKTKPTCPLCRFEIPINGEGDDQGVKRRRLV